MYNEKTTHSRLIFSERFICFLKQSSLVPTTFHSNKIPSMKKLIFLFLAVTGLLFTGCATSNSSSSKDSEDYEETTTVNSKLNNKRLEKNLEKFAADLDLSKRQVKQIKKIERRYARKDRKLSRNDEAKRRDHKQLAAQKREEILYVLTNDQQQKLETLSKKNRFSFDRIFGK